LLGWLLRLPDLASTGFGQARDVIAIPKST
jgi:hypothetical protein